MDVKTKALILYLSTVLLVNISAQSNVDFSLLPTSNGVSLSIYKGENEVLFGTIGLGIDFDEISCVGEDNCVIGDLSLKVTSDETDDIYTITWESKNLTVNFKDCFDLKIGELNWYGGPERYEQNWPVEKLILDGDDPYVIKKTDNFAVAERYWLNSKGTYIFLDDKVPLFVDQNNEEAGTVCFIAKAEDPYINRERVLLQYTIVIKDDPKEAHLHAVNNFLGKPKGHPNEKMIREPIWTTWAKYKRDINDETLLAFANDIVDHGFTGGQLEIDEDWEVCFGAHVFKPDKFANINDTVKSIKELGFRVSLWINPFVNDDCEDYSTIGKEKGYFVKNVNGNTTAIWWESEDAHQIDFTNPEAAEWFSSRVKVLLNNPGVDSFKFDAGETNYAIPPSLYENVDAETVPNCLTNSYINVCAEFGDSIEVRSAWRTQELPIFLRMIDKDSLWTEKDGLYTLISTLLQLNMNGYTMILPDMIGGNAYIAQPTAELIVRWTQANTFMPAMQFSFLPWDFPTDEFDVVEIVRKFVKLHEEFADEILKAMNASIEIGTPVNPPIWWADPTDPVALANDDEFLLGENILIAPVYKEGARSRDIYLPKGYWKDGISGITYGGPRNLTDFEVSIDNLPYFIKIEQ